MIRPFRVLIVEDSPDDGELMVLALRRGEHDPTWQRVESADGLQTALAAGPWDVVLSAFVLPGFGGPAALEIVRAADPDLPFIVVSETVGEDAAVAMMRAGASDYVRKHDIARLAPAVEREVHESANRRAKRAAERAAGHLAAIVESSDDAIISKTLDGVITTWNPAADRLYGWTAAEAIGRHISFLIPPDKAAELSRIMDRLQAGEHVEYFETARMHRDGRRIDVSETVSPVRGADGRVVGVSKTARDIRERKRAEEALRASEERYRALIESIPALVWVSDTAGRSVLHNRRWYEYTGQSGQDTAADRWREAVHPDDVVEAVAAWERCKASGEPYAQEYRLRRADGVYRWFLSKKTAHRGTAGIEQWIGMCTDIDDRKQAEADLRQTADLLRAVADGTTDAVFVKDRDGKYVLFNESAARFVGLPVSEVLGKDDTELFDPAGARFVMNRDLLVMASGQAETEEEILTAAGVTRTYQATKAPYRDQAGNIIGVIGVSRDVTDRTRSEAALRASEERTRLILDTANDPFITIDAAGRIVDWNRQAEAVFGWTRDEAIGRVLSGTIVPHRFREAHEQGLRTFQATGTGLVLNNRLELPALRRDGTEFPVEVMVWPIRTGDTLTISAFVRDITERKRAESALRAAQRRLEHVVTSSPAILYTLAVVDDQILGINWISDNLRELLGYPPEDAFAPDWWVGNIHPEDREGMMSQTNGELFGKGHSTHEYRFRHRDGQYRWTRDEIRLVRDAVGQPVEAVGSWSDITERKGLEEQFRQAQKMEAVGQLAGGVAHDFNNLLTIINGYSDLLLMKLPAGDPSRDLIAEIHKAGERSAGLTRQLLAFSRQQVLAPRVLDLNEVVTDTDKMLRRLIGEDVQLATTLGPELWTVRADPGQIEQVLMNLAVNARDAMPRGGRLTIETRNAELDETYVRTHPGASSGPHVLLSVSDSGSGMSSEVKARLFEPFFTTKGPGIGTGLGLATVYGIVKQSGGHIAAYSEVGVGTSFKVYLPRVDQPAEGARVRPELRTSPRGTETILVVEDEAGVRALTHHVLAGYGYTVLEAADGGEAVRVAAEHGGPIHLLVTDVVMPGAGGRAVAEQVAERRPGVRVLFVSGYTDDAVIRHGVLREGVNFLQKPFSPVGLGFKVREVLDAPAEIRL